jgi:hypothetical protein
VTSIPAAKVKEALASGVEFIVAGQGVDGLWHDFQTLAGEAADWPTGFIGACLSDAGVRGRPIDAAVAAVVGGQHKDGGWGYHGGVPSDADSTAWVLTFLAAAGGEGHVLERAGRCLRLHQDGRTGGIATYAGPGPIRRFISAGRGADLRGWCTPHLEVTATAGRAFAAVPRGRFRADAELAWRYVSPRQDADGSWGSYWWVGRHYPTLQAFLLGEALGEREAGQRAVAWAVARQGPDGSWGGDDGSERSAFATASCLTMLLCGGGGKAATAGLSALIDLQRDDGGWPGDALMRIPPPHVVEPDRHVSWNVGDFGTGVVVSDHHRLFTTAACVAALTLAAESLG